MRCLSPLFPAKRVVTMIASQLMKTQVALNWIGGCIHMAPANILVLLPTEKLSKRVSGRIDKTIKAVPVLTARVAKARSRDSRNTLDTKEFEGGALYCASAGSASNLAELSARYVYGDEIDRWEMDVDDDGDPVKQAEARGSTFGRRAKFYYSSSPTLKGVSRIADLFTQGDQRHYYVPCPHCGTMQVLEWEGLKYDPEYRLVQYMCSNEECGALIEEHHKAAMLSAGEWRAHAVGDGETVSFTLSALYAPPGWLTWTDLAKEYDEAKRLQEKGDPGPCRCSTTPAWPGCGQRRGNDQGGRAAQASRGRGASAGSGTRRSAAADRGGRYPAQPLGNAGDGLGRGPGALDGRFPGDPWRPDRRADLGAARRAPEGSISARQRCGPGHLRGLHRLGWTPYP